MKEETARSPRATYYGIAHCANPWNGECRNADIVLYILYKGNRLPICQSCWNEIADSGFEWGQEHAF